MKLKYIIILFILSSCYTKTEFSNVSIYTPSYTHSRYDIGFISNNDYDNNINYWYNDNKKHITSNYKKGDKIPLVFLKPSTKYKFKINSGSTSSSIYTFKTRDLPNVFPSFKLKKDSSYHFDGYLLFRTQDNPGIQFMMDDLGDIVWYSISDSTLSRPFNIGSDFSYMSQSKKNMFHEISFNADTLFSKNTESKILHHDILKNDSIYVALTYEYLNYATNDYDSLIGDGIIVFDLKGNTIWQWNIFDHLNPVDENYMVREDWSHANAIDVDYDGNYLVSFRNFDQIWKIHSVSGEILWKLGIDGDFNLSDPDIFLQQHAIHKISTNEYLLFDNGLKDIRNTSRAFSFSINLEKKKIYNTKSVFLPYDLFSFKQGSVYLIDDNNYLFSSSVNNRTVITNNEGEILWDLSSDHSYYRVYYVHKNFITN